MCPIAVAAKGRRRYRVRESLADRPRNVAANRTPNRKDDSLRGYRTSTFETDVRAESVSSSLVFQRSVIRAGRESQRTSQTRHKKTRSTNRPSVDRTKIVASPTAGDRCCPKQSSRAIPSRLPATRLQSELGWRCILKSSWWKSRTKSFTRQSKHHRQAGRRLPPVHCPQNRGADAQWH